MFTYLIKFIAWSNKNIARGLTLYLTLFLVAYYSYIFINKSEWIRLLWFVSSFMKLILCLVISIHTFNKISFDFVKFKPKWRISVLIIKNIIAILIPIIITTTISHLVDKEISVKLENNSEISSAKIYNLIYSNGHLIGNSGYEYEFYINKNRYLGREMNSSGKLGQIIKVKYFKDNPWINKKI
ncbi:hypothetical protein [Flammeovirga sp. SubArs3]|uniref:hypothetical protein n=1 Tax=Flammeovirga sp. SubArs3 TaxID=2995316 RepID=UPI00248CE10E|nr:hypothetical protein [Flammeovirga sp. SubArs3]